MFWAVFLPNAFIDCKPDQVVGSYPTNDAGGNDLQNSHLICSLELFWQGTPVLTLVAIFYATLSTLEARPFRTVSTSLTNHLHWRQGSPELCF
jgi:hypothetical protein